MLTSVPTTTTALVHDGPTKPASLQTVRLSALRDDEALVEIHASGICHTDLLSAEGHLYAQFPCILGHEGSGRILAVGPAISKVKPGDSVLLSFAHCQNCESCDEGHPGYCHKFLEHNFGMLRVADNSRAISLADDKPCYTNFFGQSSFSKHAVVHASSLVKVPSDTDLALFAPLGCGFQTGAGTILNGLDVQPGKSCVIFGAGGVGMAGIMAAKIRGADPIIAVDLLPDRLELAKELGATHVINGKDEDIVDQIRKLCPPFGARYAMDATGVPKVIETMIESLGNRGRGAQVGAARPGAKAGITINPLLEIGKQYMGVIEGDCVPEKSVPYFIEQYHKGNFPIDKLIKYYPLDQIQQAWQDTKAGKTIKAVVKWV